LTSADAIGWAATALVVASYFCRRQEWLRLLQLAGAALWIVYGLWIRSTPVVGANILVLSAAGATLIAGRNAGRRRQATGRQEESRSL
jgi:hypothetical protein